ncbi:hypothetical protein BH20ACI4_BH20ACI4_03840 [soil metagenome]
MKNQTIKNNLLSSVIFAGFLAIVFFAAGSVSVSAYEGDEDADCRSKSCRQALVDAKQATARYHDVQNALDDGFFQASPCVSHPTLGAMGFHFINIGRIMNPLVKPDEPEVLLYLPNENGEMKLVGLEYVVPLGLATEPPVLFGQTFHTNGPPLNQYALHVWAWRNNPSGIFAPFNPKLSCPS